jgi:hypothetical protein
VDSKKKHSGREPASVSSKSDLREVGDVQEVPALVQMLIGKTIGDAQLSAIRECDGVRSGRADHKKNPNKSHERSKCAGGEKDGELVLCQKVDENEE